MWALGFHLFTFYLSFVINNTIISIFLHFNPLFLYFVSCRISGLQQWFDLSDSMLSQ
jgi:hypothetical protein